MIDNQNLIEIIINNLESTLVDNGIRSHIITQVLNDVEDILEYALERQSDDEEDEEDDE